MGKEEKRARFWELDALRGTAVLMMAVFHFLWDLNFLGVLQIALYEGAWGLFQKSIVFLFLFLAGIGLWLSHAHRKGTGYSRHFVSRGLLVFLAGLGVSAFTFLLFPAMWVKFGILHLIGASILLSLPFVRRPRLALVAGIALLLAPLFFDLRTLGLAPFFWLGLAWPPAALDFVPVIPWFGVVLLGIFAGSRAYGEKSEKKKIARPDLFFLSWLELLGRHALLIYLGHQFLLFPLAWVISSIF